MGDVLLQEYCAQWTARVMSGAGVIGAQRSVDANAQAWKSRVARKWFGGPRVSWLLL